MSAISSKPKAKSSRVPGKPRRPRRQKRKKKSRIPKGSLRVSPVHSWLASAKRVNDWVDLKCKRLPLVTGGSQRVSDKVFPPLDTTAASAFVSLDTVYTFRLAGSARLAYTSTVINTFYACDPSSGGVNFGEWSTLSALFSEFRMVRFSIRLVPSWFPNDTASYQPLWIAGNLGTAVNPGSTAALADNADSMIWNAHGDHTSNGYKHTLHGRGLGWSQVTTPTVEPFAGAPGSIQLYGSCSASPTDAYDVLVEGVYEFRSRV